MSSPLEITSALPSSKVLCLIFCFAGINAHIGWIWVRPICGGIMVRLPVHQPVQKRHVGDAFISEMSSTAWWVGHCRPTKAWNKAVNFDGVWNTCVGSETFKGPHG